jgi:hypothetical protein
MLKIMTPNSGRLNAFYYTFWYAYNYIFIERDLKIHRSMYAHKYMYAYSLFGLCIALRVTRTQTKFCPYAACNTRNVERTRITGKWVSTDNGKGHGKRLL